MTIHLKQQLLKDQSPMALQKSWQASLSLAFEKRTRKTSLTRALHKGPLRVQRAFYPEGPSVPHVYLLHPPGGVVAGDELSITIDIGRRAHGLVTTPSAGRIYRTNEQGLQQIQTLSAKVEENGLLEWMPQENIVFNGANGFSYSRFDLHAGAKLIAWDVSCLGRPAGEQPFIKGCFVQRLEVVQNQLPLLVERMAVDTQSHMLSAGWGFQGFTVFGTMVATIENQAVLTDLKKTLQHQSHQYLLAFTQKQSLLIVRYMGHSAIEARTCFSKVWSAIRPIMIERKACEPRIWHT